MAALILSPDVLVALQVAAIAAGTYLAAWVVRRIFLRSVEHAEGRNVIARRIGRVLQGIIVVIGILSIFAVLQIDVSSVVIGLGAVSIAVSYALSTLLNNLVAGILIMADDSVRVGDTIKVGDFQGRVIRMRTRATELETPEGKRVFVPNVYLAQNPVQRLARDRSSPRDRKAG